MLIKKPTSLSLRMETTRHQIVAMRAIPGNDHAYPCTLYSALVLIDGHCHIVENLEGCTMYFDDDVTPEASCCCAEEPTPTLSDEDLVSASPPPLHNRNIETEVDMYLRAHGETTVRVMADYLGAPPDLIRSAIVKLKARGMVLRTGRTVPDSCSAEPVNLVSATKGLELLHTINALTLEALIIAARRSLPIPVPIYELAIQCNMTVRVINESVDLLARLGSSLASRYLMAAEGSMVIVCRDASGGVAEYVEASDE